MSNITDTITNTISEALIEEEDPCLSLETDTFDLDLHIVSIFVIMFLSFIGTLLPLIAKKIPALKIRQVPFYCAKMFGAGVILATALVHMLTPAFENLSHECLPEAFGEDGYGAWPGAICLMSICVIHLIQFLAAREVRKLQAQQSSNPSSNNGGGSPGHSHSHGTPKDKPMVGASEETTIEEGAEKQKQEEPTFNVHEHGDTDHVEAHDFIALKEKQISTYILEAGVASHSIIVGLTLGVARAEFNSLFIALTFHQFFEGIALSAVVLDTISKHKNIQTILVIIFYSLTTPIGIAIGIGISESFNSAEASGLIAQGVLDAIAAGILLYDGLVNVVVPHFKSDRFAKDPTWFQITQWAFFWFGGAVMSLIGKWA